MQLLSQIASVASLDGLDSSWQRALQTSKIVGIGSSLRSALSKAGSDAVNQAGSFFQLLGFGVALVLFAALGLHQFVNDKIVLGVIAMSGFALWIFGYLLGGKEHRQANAVDITVLVFFATNVIAACASHYLMPSIDGLAKLVIYVCSYFYFTAVLRSSPRRKLILVSLLVLMGVVQSFYGFHQFINHVQPLATWEDPTVESQGTRIFGWLDNPNLLAGYLIPISPLALALGFSALSSRKFLLAIPPLAAAAIICVAIVLTGSRGGYLAIAGAAVSISFMAVARFWIAKPKARIFIVILCIAIPVLLLLGLHFVPSFEQRLTSIFAGREHSSNSYRINVWIASWRMFLDNWWIGIGPGNKTFRLAYGLYMVSGFDALGTYCV
ncbi:MAG TPA: O-antigen ligase family protein, partial [Drouetiella sp.]